MKRDVKKILVLCLFSIILVSLVIDIVNAQNEATTQPTTNPSLTDAANKGGNVAKTGVAKISEIFAGMLGDKPYDFAANVLSPEILIFLLVFLVIFAIVSQIPLFGSKPWLSVTLSIVIAILSAGFIDPAWISPVLNQYEAIGITISFLVPFALLFYFIKNAMPDNRLLQKIVFITFFGIVFLNAILNWPKITSTFSKFLYVLILIGSGIMAVAGHKIFDYIFKEELSTSVEGWKKMQDLIRAGDRAKVEEYSKTLPMNAGQKAQIDKWLAKTSS